MDCYDSTQLIKTNNEIKLQKHGVIKEIIIVLTIQLFLRDVQRVT